MGWFDEQLRQRIDNDNDNFSDAFASMASVVMGDKITRKLNDDHIQAKNAIEEILKFYHTKPVEIPDNVHDINDQLDYLLRPTGIMRRSVQLTEDWYKDAIGAMLGIRSDDGSPVALLPDKISGYRFMDAATGKWVRVNKKTARWIDAEAICFYKPLPLKKIGIKDLCVYMLHCLSVSDLVLTALATLAVSLVGMLTPMIQREIYGTVLESGSLQILYAVFGFYLCVGISQLLISTLRSMIMTRLNTKMLIQVEAAGMMRVLSLPAGFFKEYASGNLSNRISYLRSICSMLINVVLTTGLTSLFSLIYITQMASYGPELVLPGMLVIFLTVAVSLLTSLGQLRISKRSMELGARESGLEYSLLSGIQKIRLSGAEKRAFSKWAREYTLQAKLQYDPPAYIKLSGVISTCISLVGTIVIYYYTIRSQVPLADYFAFNSAYGMVMGAFVSLVGMAGTIAGIKPMMDMVRPILETEPEIAESKRAVTHLSGGIELSNVSFRYSENSPLILNDLSLKIHPGQYVAIVGSTGCGKSTLMRLMLGFETPQKGAIYYDGVDIHSLDLRSLHQNIGTVMQNGKLFQGSLYSNILISAPQLGMKEAWDAAEMAGIADDIKAMPMGMNTMIAEGSGGISGGQKQRLMIARAIAPKPKILMLDEATSALDNLTQKIVSDSLDSLKCTRIVIAHRLSTIKQADRIIVLDQGKIVEDGTYEELAAGNGFFAELIKRQQV